MKQHDLFVFELQRYLFGEIGLKDFQDWLVPFTWSPPKSMSGLVRVVDLRIAEHTSGHMSEVELKGFLRKELENYV